MNALTQREFPFFVCDCSILKIYPEKCQTNPDTNYDYFFKIILGLGSISGNTNGVLKLLNTPFTEWEKFKRDYEKKYGYITLESLVNYNHTLPEGMPCADALEKLTELLSATRQVYIVTDDAAIRTQLQGKYKELLIDSKTFASIISALADCVIIT